MVKINKPSPPPRDVPSTTPEEEEVSGNGSMPEAADPLFSEDDLEGGAPLSSPSLYSGAAAIPQKPEIQPSGKTSPASTSIPAPSQVPESLTALGDVPNADDFREPWNQFQNREDVPADELNLLQLDYEALSESQQRLSSLRTELEQSEVRQTPSSGSLDLQRAPSGKDHRDSYQQKLKIHQQDLERFTLKLEPEFLTLHPQRNRVKNKIIVVLNQLPELKSVEPVHAVAYSEFVSELGMAASVNHRLHRTMGALEDRLDEFESRENVLLIQRANCTQFLSRSLTSDELNNVLKDVEALNENLKDHLDARQALVNQLEKFKNAVEKLTATEKHDREVRIQVAKEKNALLARLKSVGIGKPPFLSAGSCYNAFLDNVGILLAESCGVTKLYGQLATLCRANEKEYRLLGFRLEALNQEIKRATDLEELGRLSTSVGYFTRHAEVHRTSVSTAYNRFNHLTSEIDRVSEEHKRDKLLHRAEKAQELLERAPALPPLKEHTMGPANDLGFNSPRAREERARLDDNFQTLEASHQRLLRLKKSLEQQLTKANSKPKLIKVESEIESYANQVSDHHVLHQTYLREKGVFLAQLQFLRPNKKDQKAQPLSEAGQRLLEICNAGVTPFARAVNVPYVTRRNGATVNLTVGDRIAVMDALFHRDRTLSIDTQNKVGDSVPELIVAHLKLTENEKIELLHYVHQRRGKLNQANDEGLTPLGTAINMNKKQPLLISALQNMGGTLSADDQFPVTAHLLGLGGSILSPSATGEHEIFLEGLTARTAEFMIDPVISNTLGSHIADAPQSMKRALTLTYGSWYNIRKHSSFVTAIRGAEKDSSSQSFLPRVLLTGWYEPSGHAVGFVFNREADGFYLYACNTGSAKDPTRSIVKYMVTDLEKTASFFERYGGTRNEVRRFFTEDHDEMGIFRVRKKFQIPLEFDKSSQKRGNCPMASRKACLRAMLWSCSRSEEVPGETVREAYKTLTSDFRVEGVTQAIASCSPELMGRALVSMLTKFDRPKCKNLAYDLAEALLLLSPGSYTGPTPFSDKIPSMSELVTYFRHALKAGGQSTQSLTTKRGESLAAHALRKNNKLAFTILRGISKDEPPFA